MRITEEFLKTGFFWLPGDDELRAPGILKISNGGIITFEILGSLGRIYEANHFPRVSATIEGIGHITLDNCQRTSKREFIGEHIKASFQAEYCFTNWKYEAGEIPLFNTLSFSVDGLDEWLGLTGMSIDQDNENNLTTVSYRPLKNISYDLTENISLTFCFENYTHYNQSKTQLNITQSANIKLTSTTPLPLKKFTIIADRLNDFFCFAMNSAVSLHTVTAVNNDFKISFGTGEEFSIPIQLYYQSASFFDALASFNTQQIFFGFDTTRQNFESVINKWLNQYETLAAGIALYFSAKTGTHKNIQGQFLALAQGLETYHRRTDSTKLMDESLFDQLKANLLKSCPSDHVKWLEGRIMHGNEMNFGKRLKSLISPFKLEFGSEKSRTKLVKNIVDSRNYYTHYDARLSTDACGDDDLLRLAKKMECLFELCFLRDIGFSSAEIKKLAAEGTPLGEKLAD